MAGRFTRASYETNGGVVHPIRVQPETITAENPSGPAVTTSDNYARVSGSKRAYGVKARFITLARKIGSDADYSGATVYIRIPVFLATAWIAFDVNGIVALNGFDWTIASKTDESIR